jgi:hypothetical protein
MTLRSRSGRRGSVRRLLIPMLATCGIGLTSLAHAQHEGHDAQSSDEPQQAGHNAHDLLLFPSARYEARSGLDSSALDDTEATPSIDFFYSRSTERFRILGEFLLTDDEHDLERFQVGWQLSEAMRVWIGRFHQSASQWNTEHHHGPFLQTAIERPAIEEFEDQGGVVPSHTTGVLLERQQGIGSKAGIDLSVSAGLTTTLTSTQLEPLDLLDPHGGHGNSLSMRVGVLPELLGSNQFGFSFGKHQINLEPDVQLPPEWGSGTDRIELELVGLYANWGWPKWQVTAAIDRVRTAPQGGAGGQSSDFVAKYAEAEYHFRNKWIGYGRVEDTSGSTTYLDLFPKYVHARNLLGGKRLIGSKHAVTFEVASCSLANDHFEQFAVQWSAVLP